MKFAKKNHGRMVQAMVIFYGIGWEDHGIFLGIWTAMEIWMGK